MTGNVSPGVSFATPKEWTYRGEGNCNIVISLPKSKQILRIRKTDKPKSIFGWILVLISDFIQWCYGIGFRDEVRDLNFYSKIMRPLLGYKFTSAAKQVVLSRKQMQIFKDGLQKKRPDYRQDKILQYGRAALFHDYAFLPTEFDHLQFSKHTFAVEIKPKQGWRPRSEQSLPKCFFCMNQYLKLEKKRIKCKTQYCPEDLFSGDPCRMKVALRGLIEVPQNNFKIFKDGMICYDENRMDLGCLKDIFEKDDSENILLDMFCDFIQRCLVKELENRKNISSLNNCKSLCKVNLENNYLRSKLPKDSVLGRILSIQMLDEEGTSSTYRKHSKGTLLLDDFGFVDKLLNVIDQKDACIKCSLVEMTKKYENDLQFVPYLVSSIAKDCSLMITFRKLKETPSADMYAGHILETKVGDFLVNIGVFDLYPKPLSTIDKHYKRNKDIFKALRIK